MWGRYVNSKIGFLKYDGYPNFTRLLHESLLRREFDWHDSLLLNASFQRLPMTRFRLHFSKMWILPAIYKKNKGLSFTAETHVPRLIFIYGNARSVEVLNPVLF